MKADVRLEIKNVNRKTVPKIVEIHKACILQTNAKSYSKAVIDEWLNQISEQNVLTQMDTTTWRILLVEDEIIGFCQYDLNGGEIYQIQIAPEFQQKGYGKYLYNFVEKDFITHKKFRITLFATLNSVAFYESMGFKSVKQIEFPLYNEHIVMIEMCKDISSNAHVR